MEIIEKELIKKSQKGDIESFEKLISSYQKKVFNIAFGMMHNHDDAYDISQEVFIRVFKSIRKFKGQSSFSTWLYRITTNACLDELRKRKNNKNIISIDQEIQLEDGEVFRQIEDDGPTPELVAERNELREIIKEAISKLSDEHKEVIVLRDIQGFSYDDIADIIKCPQGTVKSRINRARRMLKEILKNKVELWDKDYVK
jgi:RNA polymerase sigma-70 factor (ECF subfamily)